jgi:hypothetical protein
MIKANATITKLEQALAANATLAVKIFSDGSREITLISEFFPFRPYAMQDEKTEKIFMVNLPLIAGRVKEKISKPGEGLGFLSKKAGSFSGVEQRTVQLWTERGLISPDIADTSGTGQRRLYGVLNCIEIGIIRSLAQERLSFKLIREIMAYLRAQGR